MAGIIYGAMTFVLNKLDSDANSSIEKETQEEKGTGNYTIEVNIAKNAMVIYEIEDDKSQKVIKVFPVSIGKELKKGKYSIEGKYSWVRIGDDWSQYGSKIDNLCYIGSVAYEDNYPETLKPKSYNNVGIKKSNGKNILLYTRDANWVYENCKTGTKINVIKGKDSDQLPLEMTKKIELSEYCGWDPTDPNENNPYAKVQNGNITLGTETIYIEKDSKINYYANLLAYNNDGIDITGDVAYKKIDTSELGKKKIKYTLTTSDGKTLNATQKVEIIDTTCPIVTCSKDYFTYQVKGRGTANMNTDSNVKAIESMVRNYVSVNETGCTITVKTLTAAELVEGEIPVVIKAQDASGNIGSYQVTCNITVKKAVVTDKNTPSKKIEEAESKRKEEKKANKKDAKEE